MAGIYKKLSEHDHRITPFRVHKSYQYTGTNSASGIYVLEGYDIYGTFKPNDTSLEPTNSLITTDDQYHYKRTVWNSINKLYYANSNEPGTLYGPYRV